MGKVKMLEDLLQPVIQRLDGTIGVAVKALHKDFQFLTNAGEVFHAASIIKVPILIELFRQVQKGVVPLEQEVILRDSDKIGGAGILMELHQGISLTVRDLAILMIVISDNTASNLLIDIVGLDRVNRMMDEMGMSGSRLKKKFMIPSPDPGIFNVTTPCDTMSILEKLYKGEILSGDLTSEAIEILSRQQYREKIPLLLPPDMKIAHKTGEVSGVRHDAGIVFLEDNPYVICLFTKDVGNELAADRIIAEVSEIVFTYFSNMRES